MNRRAIDTGRVDEALGAPNARLLQDATDRIARQALLAYAQHLGDRNKIQSLIHDLKSINPGDSLLQRAW
jgi:hypothetical protein